jgi:hypothetical protein
LGRDTVHFFSDLAADCRVLCIQYSTVHLTFHPQHWLSVSPFYNRPSAMTFLRLFWEITRILYIAYTFSDLPTDPWVPYIQYILTRFWCIELSVPVLGFPCLQ